MKKQKKQIEFEIVIDTLNERGYGVGTLELNDTSYNVYVLGVLPGEKVKAISFKKKRDSIFAHVVEVITPSPHRVEPREKDHHFACSPWQIMNDTYELEMKQQNIQNQYKNEASYNLDYVPIEQSPELWEYRNKVEFGFYEDWDTGFVSLSFFKREGNKGKYAIKGCELLPKQVNEVAAECVSIINDNSISSKLLKYLLVRYSFSEQKVFVQLFVKDNETLFTDSFDYSNIFKTVLNDKRVQSFEIYFSNPKSPASVYTQKLFEYGDNILSESLLEKKLQYKNSNFFQINPPAFEKLLVDLNTWLTDNGTSYNVNYLPLIDLYCGVGTIGLCLSHHFKNLIGVEVGEGTQEMSIQNAQHNNIKNAIFHQVPAEKALEFITKDSCIIVDPPRAGLHADVVEKLCNDGPNLLIYISCNPTTQARDFNELQHKYSIIYNKAYNFYPHTPHVEHMIILERR